MCRHHRRISVDINGEKRESLETQKLIALSYAESHPDIEVVKFYKDDGISGTKFDRDDFVRMLGDIKTKEINTVIVKDLSRFGRDLEEVSKYLEKIFPFMQVRFISVNDNYDSISPECDNQMLGIMISNLANDMYAKDASVKMTSAMKIKMESGEYCGVDAPYGYKRARDEKGKLGFTEIYKEQEKSTFGENVDTYTFEDWKETYKSTKINQTDLNKAFNTINRTRQQQQQQTKSQMNFESEGR